MYGILQLACVVSFWVKVPMLLAIRVRSGAPWWFVILVATSLGWGLSNASVYLERLVVSDATRRDSPCVAQPSTAAAAVISGDGAVEMGVPCRLHESVGAPYKPLEGLIYGPLYLCLCALPYWLIVGRPSSTGMTRQIAWLAGAALLIEWAAAIGEGVRGGYLDQWLMDTDPYVVPPLSIALACVVAWAVATQVLQRLDRTVRE